MNSREEENAREREREDGLDRVSVVVVVVATFVRDREIDRDYG